MQTGRSQKRSKAAFGAVINVILILILIATNGHSQDNGKQYLRASVDSLYKGNPSSAMDLLELYQLSPEHNVDTFRYWRAQIQQTDSLLTLRDERQQKVEDFLLEGEAFFAIKEFDSAIRFFEIVREEIASWEDNAFERKLREVQVMIDSLQREKAKLDVRTEAQRIGQQRIEDAQTDLEFAQKLVVADRRMEAFENFRKLHKMAPTTEIQQLAYTGMLDVLAATKKAAVLATSEEAKIQRHLEAAQMEWHITGDAQLATYEMYQAFASQRRTHYFDPDLPAPLLSLWKDYQREYYGPLEVALSVNVGTNFNSYGQVELGVNYRLPKIERLYLGGILGVSNYAGLEGTLLVMFDLLDWRKNAFIPRIGGGLGAEFINLDYGAAAGGSPVSARLVIGGRLRIGRRTCLTADFNQKFENASGPGFFRSFSDYDYGGPFIRGGILRRF